MSDTISDVTRTVTTTQETEGRLGNAMETAREQALAALADRTPTGSTAPNYKAGPIAVGRG